MDDDTRTQRIDWELEDAAYLERERKFHRSLLLERFGPLPVERTSPIAKRFPSRRDPQILTRVTFVNDTNRAPWLSRENYADAEIDLVAE